jgi:hypothetical protein
MRKFVLDGRNSIVKPAKEWMLTRGENTLPSSVPNKKPHNPLQRKQVHFDLSLMYHVVLLNSDRFRTWWETRGLHWNIHLRCDLKYEMLCSKNIYTNTNLSICQLQQFQCFTHCLRCPKKCFNLSKTCSPNLPSTPIHTHKKESLYISLHTL